MTKAGPKTAQSLVSQANRVRVKPAKLGSGRQVSLRTYGIFALLLAATAGSIHASPPGTHRDPGPVAVQRGFQAPRELEAFLDKFFAKQMKRLHIPGAVFTLVKDGKIFFAKGYGYADLRRRKPVVPDKTLFRMGSVTKLFTTTAVMQLVEQGKLRLDDDVNKYLKGWQLEGNYSAPVTVANLLTHTGGFDDRVIGIAARRKSEVVPLAQYLAARMPRRVMPAGKAFTYSNHGMALAGYLVQVVSGVPFEQYVQENILLPLGMHRTCFVPPPQLAADVAASYEFRNGAYQRVPFYDLNIPPAGALNATAADMARFMIAHLQGGRLGDARILRQDTAQDMHRQHFTCDPRLPGVAYGFMEDFENGRRAIWHNGGLPSFYTYLFLLPSENLGFFVSCNNERGELAEVLVSRFMAHYYPGKEMAGPRKPLAGFEGRVRRVVGSYRYNGYSRLSIEKFEALLGEVPVRAETDGTLRIGTGPRNRWVEVEPLFFQQVNGSGRAVFREDGSGRITHLCVGPVAFDRLPWFETAAFNLGLVGVCVLLFLSVCVAWPVGWLVRRLRSVPARGRGGARTSRFLAALISVLNLGFLAGLILFLPVISGSEFTYGVPCLAVALLVVPHVSMGLTVGLLVTTALSWKNLWFGIGGRLHLTLVALAASAFVWFLGHWNLLGFRF